MLIWPYGPNPGVTRQEQGPSKRQESWAGYKSTRTHTGLKNVKTGSGLVEGQQERPNTFD